jgi:hypothetical protein
LELYLPAHRALKKALESCIGDKTLKAARKAGLKKITIDGIVLEFGDPNNEWDTLFEGGDGVFIRRMDRDCWVTALRRAAAVDIG